jgi:hypothetical protein
MTNAHENNNVSSKTTEKRFSKNANEKVEKTNRNIRDPRVSKNLQPKEAPKRKARDESALDESGREGQRDSNATTKKPSKSKSTEIRRSTQNSRPFGSNAENNALIPAKKGVAAVPQPKKAISDEISKTKIDDDDSNRITSVRNSR